MEHLTVAEKNQVFISDGKDNIGFDNIVEDIVLNNVKRDLINDELEEYNSFDKKNKELYIDYSFPPKESFQLFSESSFLNYSRKVNRWVGVITEIKRDFFIAKLDDLDFPGTYEIGEFDVSDISPEDLDLIQLGAVFYWSLGHVMNRGQLKKESMIRFKRSAPLSVNELDEIEDWAENKYRNLVWD